MDNIERLERLNRLRTEGAITEEEYETQKRLLLVPEPNSRNRGLVLGALCIVALLTIALLMALLLTRGTEATERREPLNTVSPSASNSALAMENSALPNQAAEASPEQHRMETIRWATSREVLGSNPAYLEQRIGVPRVKDRHGMTFDLNGCEVNYGIENNSVKSFYVPIGRGCRLSFDGRVITSGTTLGSLASQGRWEASCLALCGNAADPTVDVVQGASRANGLVMVRYASADHEAVSAWADAVERRDGVTPFDVMGGQNPFMDATNPPAAALPRLRAARIQSVTVEQGY